MKKKKLINFIISLFVAVFVLNSYVSATVPQNTIIIGNNAYNLKELFSQNPSIIQAINNIGGVDKVYFKIKGQNNDKLRKVNSVDLGNDEKINLENMVIKYSDGTTIKVDDNDFLTSPVIDNPTNAVKGKILNALENLDDEVNISEYTTNTSEMWKVFDKVLKENPQIFYFKYSGSLAWPNGDLQFKYKYPKAQIISMKNELNTKVNEIISTQITSNMSDLQKELAIHDYIVNNTKYDYYNYINNTIPDISYNAYGILIKGTGVCQGYAEATKILLNKVGIECICIIGAAGGGSHAWNIVKINGKYYQEDATWDDPAPDTGMVRYKYFNLSDTEISKDHSWNTLDYPKCSSNEYDYFHSMDYMCKINNSFYYSNADDNNKLYKINIDGTGKTKLLDYRALFNIYDNGWIYFSNYSWGGYLYKVKEDGTGIVELNKIFSKPQYIKDGYLYFLDGNTNELKTFKLNQ